RLRPGDSAVMHHEDIDRVAAEGLVESRVVAVVNAARSISGRYPNVGPLLLAAAGIVLVDGVGSEVLDRVADGGRLSLDEGWLLVDGAVVGVGTRQTVESLDIELEAAKARIGAELARFAENTLEYMQAEQFLLLDTPDTP